MLMLTAPPMPVEVIFVSTLTVAAERKESVSKRNCELVTTVGTSIKWDFGRTSRKLRSDPELQGSTEGICQVVLKVGL